MIQCAAEDRASGRSLEQIRAVHAGLEPDQETDDEVCVVGRLTAVRRHGALSFGTLRDATAEIQLFVEARSVAEGVRQTFDALSHGCQVDVRGTVMTTRRGELSIRVAEITETAGAPPVEEPDSALPVAPWSGPITRGTVSRPRLSAPGVPGTSAEHRTTGPEGGMLSSAPFGPAVPPPPPETRWPVLLIAGLTALNGLLELLVLLPGHHHRLDRLEQLLDPDWFVVVNRVLQVLIGLGLLLLADQLAKRKRNAWRIALALFLVGTMGHLWKGPMLAAMVGIAMVGALLLTRDRFRAAPDPPSLLRLVRVLPTYMAAVLVFGVGSLYLERTLLVPRFTVSGAISTVVSGLVGVDGDYTFLRPRFAVFFPAALLALGVLGLAVFAVLLFRPLRARGPHTESDWRHALHLVRAHGWDTLNYFALRDDKSFFFGSDGEAMLAYTYTGGYALVAGDPIGAPASVPRLIDEFLRMCDERAWSPAFLAIRQAEFPAYAARGFRGFYLGDEAILRCDRFDLDTAHKSVRAAVRRVGRTYRFQIIAESDASDSLVRELNAISARWRGKAPERGFTMSLSQDVRGAGANPEFLLCVAIDEDGRPGGFLRLVPAYGPDFGYTLDLMRRDPDTPNGMTEFLIVSTAQALGEHGVVRFSMNFAMWGRLFAEDVRFTPLERVASRLVAVLNPYFQIRSLREFNAKFDPEWLPRTLAYRRPTDLPRVGLLYAAAEGFLAVPFIGDLLVPKAVGGVGSPSKPEQSAQPPSRETTPVR